VTTQGSPIFAYLAHHHARQYDVLRFGNAVQRQNVELVPQHPSDEPADLNLARASARFGSPTAMAPKAARRRGCVVEDASGG